VLRVKNVLLKTPTSVFGGGPSQKRAEVALPKNVRRWPFPKTCGALAMTMDDDLKALADAVESADFQAQQRVGNGPDS
jgi:hypothetical protein